MVHVISLGGSIVAPEEIDFEFLQDFSAMIMQWLDKNKKARLIFVVGGGAPARKYQQAYKHILKENKKLGAYDSKEADKIGIAATHLNAQLLKALFTSQCTEPVVYDPTAEFTFNGRILIGAGWKPGFSTDTDAIILAERFGAKIVINLSNIKKVYTDDPKKNPDAQPIDTISWGKFREMVGDEWVPGKNTPFDPVASKKAEAAGITVICANGRNIENTRHILDGKDFIGSTIGITT